MNADQFIRSCESWDEFWSRAQALKTNDEKKHAFERLTELYLLTAPEYQTILKNVWMLKDVPNSISKKLNLPLQDEGIDIIAETRRGEYWAIQSKFRSNSEKALTRTDLGTFTSLAFNTCNNIRLAVVVHTSNKPIAKADLLRSTVEIGFDRWQQLDHELSGGITGWSWIKAKIVGESTKPSARDPKPHQIAAVEDAKTHFITNKNKRGRLIMPCGTGKSLTAYWIARELNAKTIIVAVPSLSLIRQSLADWTREYLSDGINPDWLCVCSDDSVGDLEKDEFVGQVYNTGLPTETKSEKIAKFLLESKQRPIIIFTTYHSSPALAAAARKAKICFDLAILDESHKTVGSIDKPFATLLHDKKISINRRVFMTATEKVLRGSNSRIASMSDEAKEYGQRFHQLSFKKAIKDKLISDYKIVTITVKHSRVLNLFEENNLLNIRSTELTDVDAQSLAAGVGIKDVFKKYKIKHALSFHRSIEAAERFRQQQDELNKFNKLSPKTENFHISSKRSAGERVVLLDRFKKSNRGIMTNARCLTEGVDIPAIDCVLFADSKKSTTDIVQATGRALRNYKGKEYGYVVIPIVVPDDMGFTEFAETTEFKQIARVVTALSTQDERIAEEFRAVEVGISRNNRIIEIIGDVPLGINLSIEQFSDAIATRIWSSVGKANWRPFNEARKFVHSLGLESVEQWRIYINGETKPADIPNAPDRVYLNDGWSGYGDWLGTGVIASQNMEYLPFADARLFIRNLKLENSSQWRDYCLSGDKPSNIPAAPERTYANDGWCGYGDWLGTGIIAAHLRAYLPFFEARDIVSKLNLKDTEAWRAYTKSGSKRADIPANPEIVYKDDGWGGYHYWLGKTERSNNISAYRSFSEARNFSHSLKLPSKAKWVEFSKTDKFPLNIPEKPENLYKNHGWIDYRDWLGASYKSTKGRVWRSFLEAREYARALGLISRKEWNNYYEDSKIPNDIPRYPNEVYVDDGWLGFGDWLGTGNVGPKGKQWRSFKDARLYVHTLNLESQNQWNEYCDQPNQKPDDIPRTPHVVYVNDGWKNWGDWLGTGNIAPKDREYWSYEQARRFTHTLKLKTVKDWYNYTKSDERPPKLHTNPQTKYLGNGWIDWGDWLGTGYIHPKERKYKSYKDAITFVHKLGLKSQREWKAYCAKKIKPDDIPSNPNLVYDGNGWIGYPEWLGY